MKFTGYGYRKNCFGERMFFEDEMIICDDEIFRKVDDEYIIGKVELVRKLLVKCFDMARKDPFFSFKVTLDSGETWAIERSLPYVPGMFSVTYSRAWNDTDGARDMRRKAITKWITESLPK